MNLTHNDDDSDNSTKEYFMDEVHSGNLVEVIEWSKCSKGNLTNFLK